MIVDGTQINRQALESVVKKLMEQQTADEQEAMMASQPQAVAAEKSLIKAKNYMNIVSAFDVPRLRYDRQHHLFLKFVRAFKMSN